MYIATRTLIIRDQSRKRSPKLRDSSDLERENIARLDTLRIR